MTSLYNYIEYAQESYYRKYMRYLLNYLQADYSDIAKIRSGLMKILNSTNSDIIKQRCYELLDYFK